ncbi:MAG TPA: pyridoxamine 5'-phosphate oxidase family protein [Beijerinckiaceae bacterium]|jgi:hypothetical protein
MAQPAFYDDLDASLREAWRLLARGVVDRRSPFHTPVIATIGRDGAPRARIVVVRGVDGEARTVRFHTDRRTAKAEEIGRDARLALIAYDAPAKIQIRLEGRASLHASDAVADEAWVGSRPFSKVCYGTNPPPGTVIPAGEGYSLPPAEEVETGRSNFSAVLLQVESLEWLYLDRAGHRRARFTFGAAPTATWLVP